MVKSLVIADNTVISNFALVKREDILCRIFGSNFCVTQEVLTELKRGEERKVVPNRDWTWVRVLELQSPRESALFQLFSASLGKGESSCLSIAASRNLKMLTDDLDARKLAYRSGIPVSGTIGILVQAVRTEILSLSEANTLLADMMSKGYFSPVDTLDEFL